MKTQRQIILFAGILLLLAVTSYAKSGKFAVCAEKQLWIMNEANAAVLGKCGTKTWVARVIVEESQSPGSGQAIRNLQILLKMVKQSTEAKFKPLLLKQTKLPEILLANQQSDEIKLTKEVLPKHIREFLTPMMEFFITGGLVDESTWQYLEMERFSIKMQSANPTIAEMLNEVRRSIPDRKSVEREGEFYTLEYYKAGQLENKKKYSKEFFGSRERMDETKSALDYNLKSGDVLLLGMDDERYLKSLR